LPASDNTSLYSLLQTTLTIEVLPDLLVTSRTHGWQISIQILSLMQTNDLCKQPAGHHLFKTLFNSPV
jgi:hypothetical protein